ncbi:MAG: ABC transporter permease, partial [Oscillospiraceae bacterium]|nr:ABC transporter permease [Oscillospiraceae bacterium]
MTLSRIVNHYERLRIAACIGIGMLLCIVLIFLVSARPFNAIKYLAMGPFTTINRFAQVFEKAQPMLISGCAFQLMVCVSNFSLINDSCVIMAPCLICTPIILNEAVFGGIPGTLGKVVWITAACLGSSVVGAAVSMLPPLLKRTFHTNEIVTSSLLNSVFAYF